MIARTVTIVVILFIGIVLGAKFPQLNLLSKVGL